MMPLKGNRGFAELTGGGAGQGGAGQGAPGQGASGVRLPPRTGFLESRDNRLAALAAGTSLTRVHELVDPARCRIWTAHNRDYAALTEATCADLIESLRAQGRQEVPAIVRRIANDPAHDFEVICGARRHWSISWLRAHDHPEFRFLVEPRELSDEDAFRVADLENRSRKDLSDYERATDYARAVDAYYGGSQQRMSERLQVTKSWLSRYLELAKLPAGIVAAYGTPHALGISHAARLAPLLRAPASRARLLGQAEGIAAEQAVRHGAGDSWLAAAAVTTRLTEAPRPPCPAPQRAEARDAKGRVIARAERGRGGAVTITIPKPGSHPGRLEDLVGGVRTMLETLLP